MNEKSVEELIEASSLGTPAAKAFRESVSEEEAQRLVDRAQAIEAVQSPVGVESNQETQKWTD